jgi:hypothetical protein
LEKFSKVSVRLKLDAASLMPVVSVLLLVDAREKEDFEVALVE